MIPILDHGMITQCGSNLSTDFLEKFFRLNLLWKKRVDQNNGVGENQE